MASAKIVLDTRRAKDGDAYPIIVRIYHKSKSLPISTGYSCTIAQWDASSLKIKKSKEYKDWPEANAKIHKIFSDTTTFINNNKKRLGRLDCYELRREILVQDGSEEASDDISVGMAFEKYMDYLNNEGIPSHKAKKRTKEYVIEVKRIVGFILTVIPESASVFNVGDREAGLFFDALKRLRSESGAPLRAKTFNKYVTYARSFFEFIIKSGYQCKNPFNDIILRKTKTNPKMVELEEFHEMINKISPDNSFATYTYKDKLGAQRTERKNMYTPWLRHGLMLALLGGGRRREEIAFLKWSAVIPNGGSLVGGLLLYQNLKVERLSNTQFDDESLPIEIPITRQLADLLIDMGWEHKKRPSEFILGPEVENRAYIISGLTKGFAHYYKQINNPRPGISFKCLRKTYITYARAILADKAKILTGHTTDRVIEDHYEDKKLIREKIVDRLNF